MKVYDAIRDEAGLIPALAQNLAEASERLVSAVGRISGLIDGSPDSTEFGKLVMSLSARNQERPFTNAEIDRIAAAVEPPEVDLPDGELRADALAKAVFNMEQGPDRRILEHRLQKEASMFVRDYVKSHSVLYRVLPAHRADVSSLSWDDDGGCLRIRCEREPNTPAAKWVQLDSVPEPEYVRGYHYWVYVARCLSPDFRVDEIDVLSGRRKFSDILTDAAREVALTLDGRMFDAARSICTDADGPGDTAPASVSGGPCGLMNVTNPNNISGKCQWMAGLPPTRDGFRKATSMLPSGDADGRFACRNFTCVMNGRTAEALKAVESESADGIMGVRPVISDDTTNVKDGDVYFFTEPDFLGRFLYIDDWTAFTRVEAYFLSAFTYFMGGFAFGNTAGMALAQFDMEQVKKENNQ